MKILVTGSTGFIGKSLCEALLTKPDLIVVGTGRSSTTLKASNFSF